MVKNGEEVTLFAEKRPMKETETHGLSATNTEYCGKEWTLKI